MSAEEVIRKHRQRLEEHKRFLDSGIHSSPQNTPRSCRVQHRDNQKPESTPTTARAHTSRRYETVEEYSLKESGLIEDSESGKYFTDNPTRVFDRNNRWLQRRDKTIEELRRANSNNDIEGCTFRPNTNRTSSPSLSQTRDREPLYSPTSAKASTNHVLRQRHARAERSMQKERGQLDVSQWEPRVTKPKEFSFGNRSGEPIPSLRKPVSHCRVSEDGEVRPFSARSSQGQSRTSRVSSEGNDSPKRSTSAPRRNAAPSSAPGRPDRLASYEAVKQMEKTISDQDLEIARLKGLVSSLKRELDVAKIKVRQMALAQQTSNSL